MPLRRRQLLPNEGILVFGPRYDAVRAIGDHHLPACRQCICCDQTCYGVLILRPPKDVAALAADLYGHGDAEQEMVDDGSHEYACHLRLTCCEGPLYRFGNNRLWQRLAEGHKCIDELLHVAVD